MPEPDGAAALDGDALVRRLTEDYERAHERLYGYRHAGRQLEVVAVRVELIAAPPQEPRRAALRDWRVQGERCAKCSRKGAKAQRGEKT